MYSYTSDKLNDNTIPAIKRRRLCMDCGHSMVEVDSCVENDIHYIWYKCIKCNGQWLHKESICVPQYNKDVSPPTRL